MESRDDEREALIREARSWPRDGINEGALVNALADEIERLAARKHPEPEITDEMVERGAIAACYVAGDGPWGLLDNQEEWRVTARAVLEAALRVPVGEGEQ